LKNGRLIFAVLFAIAMIPVIGLTAAIQLENTDHFCTSCHTEPETTYVDRTNQLGIDLASNHAQYETVVRCIDCHSGEGLTGRAVSLKQRLVDLIDCLKSGYSQPPKTTNPMGDAGCRKCHMSTANQGTVKTESTITSKSHYHISSYLTEWLERLPNPAESCAACHPAHTEPNDNATDNGYA